MNFSSYSRSTNLHLKTWALNTSNHNILGPLINSHSNLLTPNIHINLVHPLLQKLFMLNREILHLLLLQIINHRLGKGPQSIIYITPIILQMLHPSISKVSLLNFPKYPLISSAITINFMFNQLLRVLVPFQDFLNPIRPDYIHEPFSNNHPPLLTVNT